jgi:hypothetical protein
MSSMFEGPSQPSRIFSAPPQRRLFWPKVLGAFAAGVVVTVLITKIPSNPNPVPAPVTSSKLSRVEAAKQREQAAKAEQERKAAARSEAPNNDTRPGELAGAPPPAAQGGTASPAPQSDSTTAAQAPAAPAADPNQQIAKQADELNCAQQTWPYVDDKCREANGSANQSTRPVRVIPSDRSAPSSVTTAAPTEATVPMPPAKPRVADTPSSTPPAPRVATEAPRATTGAAPAAETPREPARREQAEAPVRAAPAPVAAPPSRETTGVATTETVQDTPTATRKSSERRQRRDASRRERGNETVGESRRSREATRTRGRSADDEDDVDMVVRERRLPDGRRVIIQRRVADDAADDEGSARRVIIQRRTVNRDDEPEERAPAPGLRLPPFFINPFGER